MLSQLYENFKNMRDIKYIAVHCTAGPATQTTKAIKDYWKNNLGWKSVGYHYLINADGTIEQLAQESEITNGVAGFNSVIVNISYKGGVDANNKPKDTRTPQQKESILKLLKELKKRYPKAIIQGHKDFPNVKKACPSFEVKKEYANI
jgi:N-acetylmuramoyl-L-alanine amidase